MSESLSPEERLFKVIQQGKRTTGQDSGVREKKNDGWLDRSKRFIASYTGGKPGADWKKSLLSRIKWPELEPENINRVLAVVFGIVFVFTICAALKKNKDVAAIAAAVSRIKVSSEEGKKRVEPLKELSFYLKEIRKRDVFHSGVGAPSGESVQKSSEPLVKAPENLKLQGISWGDVPKAMILWQSGKDSKMYFLVEGQALGTTGFKVTKISKSTVTVDDGKEETVLL